MTITIHFDEGGHNLKIELPLALMLAEIADIKRTLTDMQIDLTKIKAAVARETDVDQAILKLVQDMAAHQADLAKQLADAIAANDPAAIAQVQADLDASAQTMTANADSIASAVTQNTPAA